MSLFGAVVPSGLKGFWCLQRCQFAGVGGTAGVKEQRNSNGSTSGRVSGVLPFHGFPLLVSFRSINKSYWRITECMSDWQKHSAPREPIRTVITQFQSNSSLWMLKPFRVLVTPVSLAPRHRTSERPWAFVSHWALSWVISHLFSFHWFQFEQHRRMQPLMCKLSIHRWISVVFRVQYLSSDRCDQILHFKVILALFPFLLLSLLWESISWAYFCTFFLELMLG